MAFKKIILQLPAEGYTGETVKHTITATNLKNNPELVELGKKEGDEIDIIKPVDETENNEPAATPGATKPIKPVGTNVKSKTAKDKEASTSDSEKVVNTPTSEKRAAEIAKQFNVELVVENLETGEFFTSKNLAELSVKGDKSKLKNHNF